MRKIALIAPEADKLAEIKKMLADYEQEIIFKAASIHDGLKIIGPLIEQGVEIIIARGEAAAVLQLNHPEVVVVNVPIKAFDFVSTLERARQYGDKIAVVAFQSSTAQIERLESALGVRIKRYDLLSQDVDHVNGMIDTALQDGANVIIGGFITTTISRQRNLPCVQLIPGNQAYVETFFNARALLTSLEQEKRKTGLIKTVLNHAYEGIISIDENCNITTANPIAQKILRFTESQGKKVNDVWKALELDVTVKTGKEELNRIFMVNSVQVLCNKVPIKDGKKIIGAVATFQDITKIQMAEARIRKEVYSKGHVASFRFTDVYGSSKPIQSAVAMAKSFSVTEANVLITGETGSGKEVFAQSIHNNSKRSQGPFVALNCASIPAQLLESELFGYVGGAFTGASKDGKPGLFEVAHTGTIFLDEIGELDYLNQGRLLRVLQEKAVVRVGSDRVLPVDVRIIAATNKNLSEMVAQHKFREDLFYRLNVLHLSIPPLRERKKDIALYANQFLKDIAGGRKLVLSRGAIRILEEYQWAGNIRELKNIIDRIAAIAPQKVVSASFLKKLLGIESKADRDYSDGEAQDILAALDSCQGRIGEAAKVLKISRSTLWRKMNSLGLHAK